MLQKIFLCTVLWICQCTDLFCGKGRGQSGCEQYWK